MRHSGEIPTIDPLQKEELNGEEKTNSLMHFLGNDLNVILVSTGLVETCRHRIDSHTCPDELSTQEKIIKYEKSIQEHKTSMLKKIDEWLKSNFEETDTINRKKLIEIRELLENATSAIDYHEIIKYYNAEIRTPYIKHEHHK